MSSPFRRYLPADDDLRITSLHGLDAREYAQAAKQDSFTGGLIEGWAPLYPEVFRGISDDGVVRPDVHLPQPVRPGEEAPTAALVAAASALVAGLDPATAEKLRYPLAAHEWRSWANPEFMQYDTGVRLEELEQPVRDACLAVLEAGLSPEGYELVRTAMRINGFLGDEVGLPLLMNEYSYNFALYGEPSATEPWGFNFFGHHVAVNLLVFGERIVISPVFLGAEPDTIDAGPHAGARVFDDRIDLARRLMAELAPEQRDRVISYPTLVDASMPPGRIHPGDERHLAGCFQDNRIIPYEGVRCDELSEAACALVVELLSRFLVLLPAGPATARLREIEAHLDDTWFSWIGGWQGAAPFYFRLQSPVVIAELDHHCGVFLTNDEPAEFHIHTVLRTPHRGDYGRALIEHASGEPLVELPAGPAL